MRRLQMPCRGVCACSRGSHMRGILLATLLAGLRPNVRKCLKSLEARVGFEPTNGGFADLSLGPLGYRAKLFSIAKRRTSVRALLEAANSLRSTFASAFKSSCKQDAQICFFYSISCGIKSFKSWRILRFPAALSQA